MAKKIIKEIIIILLLCLAIILILGVLLYDYVPMAKIVPEPVSYTTPEEVEKELLEASEIDQSQIVMTYEIDGTDLNNYKRIQEYNPGKTNPFSSYKTVTGNVTGNSSSTTQSQNGTNSSGASNSNNNTTSGGTYFQDKGTK